MGKTIAKGAARRRWPVGVSWKHGSMFHGRRGRVCGGFSLVEHPMSARALVRHCIDTREDEHSHVLVGRVGALLGDDVLVSGPGDLIFKPRNQWHTFWNADDEPARILEIISPAGFEKYFAELVELGGSRNASPEALRALGQRYGLEVDPQSIPKLLQRFDLRVGEPI